MQFIVSPVQQNSVSYPGLDPNKRYVIAASNSGHVLTVRGDGVYLEQRKWSENAAQQWRIEKISGTNYHKIISVASGKVLDIEGGSTADLAGVCVWSWGGGNNQQFELIYLGASKFRVQARHSGKVLDVEGGGNAEGARIIQHAWHGGNNQQFRVSELLDISTGPSFDSKVTLYEHGSYGGVSKQLGLGSYNVGELGIPNDSLSSMKIPSGMRVTLYEHENFRGRTKVFTSDTTYVGDDFNDLTSAILIDLVATVYEHGSYQGRSQALGVGNYPMSALTFGNDAISSIKVPPGMQVILFEHEFSGARKVVTTDIPFLSDFNDTTSSIQVKMVGVVIPDDAIRFGGDIVLRSVHNKFLTADTAGSVRNDATTVTDQAKLTVVRAGSVANGTYLSYGDVIALETSASHHIGVSGTGLAATGDPTNGKPSVCSMGAGKIHMFARGPNGSAWWRKLDGHWGAWVDLGGGIIGAPAAVSWGTNHVAMVVRGTDNAVWIRTWNGSTWSDWASIGGNVTSSPTICSWGPGRLDVFARGADGSLAHAWFANNAWSGWESLGGGLIGAPAAVSWGSNRIDVIVRGTDNACYIRSWVGTSWPSWSSLGGVLSDEPTVCSWASGRLDIFVRNTGGGVSHRAFEGGWGGWEDLGGTIQGGPAACSWGPGRIDVFARGGNNNIWHRRWA